MRLVVCEDSLGLGAELEADMQELVDSYECEWKKAIDDSETLKRFRHFVNSGRLDDDSVYALANHDPFSGANVLSRGIVGDVKGELVVASPVYMPHFSLATGQCLEDAEVRVPVYRVRAEAGTVRGRPDRPPGKKLPHP